jgi:hypothetical protein
MEKLEIKQTDRAFLEPFINNLVPGCSGSKYAGFKGNQKIEKAKNGDDEFFFLINIEGWHGYSKKYFRKINRSALIVSDETGNHAVRVPPQLDIFQAIKYLKPAAVKKAEAEGREVVRQGDVYFVESQKNNFKEISNSFHRVTETAEVRHPQHNTLQLNFFKKYTAYRQKASNYKTD